MVDVLGHIGTALFFLAPAWLVFRETRVAALFVAAFTPFGLLPDVDLYLSNWVPGVHHHGVVHTILAVSIMAVVLGPLVGRVFVALAERTSFVERPARVHEYAVGVAGVWVAGISHLFADILSAPDASTVIEPFWPLYTGRLVSIDVLFYQSIWARWGLLVLGIGCNVALWYWHSTRRDRRAATPPTT